MKRVGVVDYFVGNIFSVAKAFEYFGCRVRIILKPEDFHAVDYLVLPGVGAFGDGVRSLKERGLIGGLTEFVKTGKPFLGICLGMQLLFASSEEFGFHEGLNLVAGRVRRLPDQPGLKIPNIGWHPLRAPGESACGPRQHGILKAVMESADLYFVHSFAGYPDDPRCWLASTLYGGHSFCSAVQKDNVIGLQFHPEKSGAVGLGILNEFLKS